MAQQKSQHHAAEVTRQWIGLGCGALSCHFFSFPGRLAQPDKWKLGQEMAESAAKNKKAANNGGL
jgi:hypothetical protein